MKAIFDVADIVKLVKEKYGIECFDLELREKIRVSPEMIERPKEKCVFIRIRNVFCKID